MGTDWPAAGYFSTFKPLDAIQIGVTRKLLDKTDADPCLQPANERLGLADALHANTLGAAYQLRMDEEIGSIEVGKLADLVVIKKNFFKVPKNRDRQYVGRDVDDERNLHASEIRLGTTLRDGKSDRVSRYTWRHTVRPHDLDYAGRSSQ